MASLTRRAHLVRLVAADTARHAGDTGVLRHRVHLRYLAVAHHALHAGSEMLAVRPGHAGSDLVDALPWNRLASARELGKFCDRGFVFGDGSVARHADSRRR